MPRNSIEDLQWRVGLLEESPLSLGFDEVVFIFDRIRHAVNRRGAELGYPLIMVQRRIREQAVADEVIKEVPYDFVRGRVGRP